MLIGDHHQLPPVVKNRAFQQLVIACPQLLAKQILRSMYEKIMKIMKSKQQHTGGKPTTGVTESDTWGNRKWWKDAFPRWGNMDIWISPCMLALSDSRPLRWTWTCKAVRGGETHQAARGCQNWEWWGSNIGNPIPGGFDSYFNPYFPVYQKHIAIKWGVCPNFPVLRETIGVLQLFAATTGRALRSCTAGAIAISAICPTSSQMRGNVRKDQKGQHFNCWIFMEVAWILMEFDIVYWIVLNSFGCVWK